MISLLDVPEFPNFDCSELSESLLLDDDSIITALCLLLELTLDDELLMLDELLFTLLELIPYA